MSDKPKNGERVRVTFEGIYRNDDPDSFPGRIQLDHGPSVAWGPFLGKFDFQVIVPGWDVIGAVIRLGKNPEATYVRTNGGWRRANFEGLFTTRDLTAAYGHAAVTVLYAPEGDK